MMTNTNTESNSTIVDDKLREKIRQVLTKTWLHRSEIYCDDSKGNRKEVVKFTYEPFKVGPSEKTLDKLMHLVVERERMARIDEINRVDLNVHIPPRMSREIVIEAIPAIINKRLEDRLDALGYYND